VFTLAIIAIIIFFVWKAAKGTAQRDAAVAIANATIAEANERVKRAEQQAEVEKLERRAGKEVRDSVNRLKASGADLETMLLGLVTMMEDEPETIEPIHVHKLAISMWTHMLSFASLVYLARSVSREVLEAEVDLRSVGDNVDEGIGRCFEALEALTSQQPDLPVTKVIGGIHKVVGGLIEATNAKDQQLLRQMIKASLEQLDSLMESLSSDAA
jgi:hypothetical protein